MLALLREFSLQKSNISWENTIQVSDFGHKFKLVETNDENASLVLNKDDNLKEWLLSNRWKAHLLFDENLTVK